MLSPPTTKLCSLRVQYRHDALRKSRGDNTGAKTKAGAKGRALRTMKRAVNLAAYQVSGRLTAVHRGLPR